MVIIGASVGNQVGQEDSPKQANELTGEVPPLPRDPELNDSLDHVQLEAAKKFNETYPEEIVFSLRDLTLLY